jgi:hypothetical protein
MKRNIFWCFSFLVMVVVGCSNAKQEKNDMVLKSVNESLLAASGNSEGQIDQIMKAFQVKMKDPAAYENTVIWFEKAQSIHKLATETYEYIDSLKRALPNASSGIYEIMLENDKGKRLYDMLSQCRMKSLAVDSAITEEFKYMKVITTKSFDSPSEKGKDFTKYFFKNVSFQQAIGVLTKFQCDLRSAEYQMISFCYRQTAEVIYDCRLNFPKIIAFHTTKTVKPNASIEIVVQLDDEYFKGTKPMITLDGMPLILDEGWSGTMSIKASSKRGKHKLPITVTNKDFRTGKMETMTKDFTYYVDSIPTKQ